MNPRAPVTANTDAQPKRTNSSDASGIPSVRPTLLPAKNMPTANARRSFGKVSRMTREPDGIISDSPIPSSARNPASGSNARVMAQSAVASDQNPTPSG